MSHPLRYFIAGTDTGVGKTVVAAIITEALQADYWKPVQTGASDGTDSKQVRQWVNNRRTVIHPESVCLQAPLSPHAAADNEGVRLQPETIRPPETDHHLVAEGAGGLMVPLTEKYLLIDWLSAYRWPVILVSRHYLGSINHTLLSVEVLQTRNIPVQGIVFNGPPTRSTESVILRRTGLPLLGKVMPEPALNARIIKRYARIFAPNLAA